ncbi:magnesium transporter NIPA-domain-containing protein, partial [Hysterangium stoloniferum]
SVGVALAIGSGVLIGSSFVFKKKGLLSSQKGHVAGEGVAYLKSPLWWSGMIIMILGEICNLVAYSFLEAIIVTPMGALSVVISAMLSHLVLKERLSLFGWISCLQCLLGATILALNGPEEQSVTTIAAFKALFLAPSFLAYGSVIIAAALVLALFVAPRWGQRSMLPYIGVCSLIGGLSVSCTQGLGACIVTTIRGENQFKNWFIYFLLVFVIVTLLTEIYYLNIALALFNTAMVTPTYYVMFTFCTLVTSVILYKGLKASATEIMTVVLAFFVICSGIFILQMSKVDPRELVSIDKSTSLLLKAARAEVDPNAAKELEQEEDRAVVAKTEDPGIDALRGTFGTVGTIIRARRRATALAQVRARARAASESAAGGMADGQLRSHGVNGLGGGDPEKAVFRREGDVPSPPVLVATPESKAVLPAAAGVDKSGGGGSAATTLEQSKQGQDNTFPIAQAGAALEDADRRARTLPTVLKSDDKPAFLDSHKWHTT